MSSFSDSLPEIPEAVRSGGCRARTALSGDCRRRLRTAAERPEAAAIEAEAERSRPAAPPPVPRQVTAVPLRAGSVGAGAAAPGAALPPLPVSLTGRAAGWGLHGGRRRLQGDPRAGERCRRPCPRPQGRRHRARRGRAAPSGVRSVGERGRRSAAGGQAAR